uniref:Galectin n=1 Tax=Macaca nemestrina TaxID=9545 RepID=A0A2K6CXY5_MACNE
MSSLPVPYKLPVSLSVGSCVIIKGTPIDSFINDPQLQVDFYTDMDEDSDIAFHFRVHFGNHVVMNRREFGIWMLEETTDYVPFEDGKQFELCVTMTSQELPAPRLCGFPKREIKVNGIRIYGFVHRIPPSFVKMMQVSRDVSLTSVCVCN